MSKKVLLVEDNENSRAFLKCVIELDGHEVIEAANGRRAIEIAQTEVIDLLLMDIAMPDMSGLLVIKVIRESGISNNVPAVAMSGFGNFFHEKALNSGFDCFVDKPVNLQRLEPILEEYLGITEPSNEIQ